ncbi:PREDICTED: transport and Golgi organization protein 11 [Ceratosolen solmsi marchali]|uniref:Transport and Golgi organization protein 11 n=1 Tax=Ceratosolen solmsi marchali TaxID=326594 RepID=A0AAJ6YWN8_9HYME|nr:PREDICTED: transport and Golgi organization protein 11 [Ceratosolen solmsi marchali]
MANAHSPTRFNGEADHFFDPNFTIDINNKMRVPKSIRVSGDYTDEDVIGTNGSAWNIMSEKYEMHVPDRIIVIGQEQHIGTKAPPREITLENAVLHNEPPIRCSTPPQILTLDAHYFPIIGDDLKQNGTDLEVVNAKPDNYFNNETQSIDRHGREQTPGYGSLDNSLAPVEEIHHLRRQVGKLNRQVMAIESEIQQQQQRMKLIYSITAIYFFFKTIVRWYINEMPNLKLTAMLPET